MSRKICLPLKDPVDNLSGTHPTLHFRSVLGVRFMRKCVILSVRQAIRCPCALRLWCSSTVFLFNVRENSGKGSVEVWNLCRCLPGPQGAVSCFLTVGGRKHERGLSFTPCSKCLWASVLEASSVCHANIYQASLWHCEGIGYAKTRACGGKQQSRINWKFQCQGKCWAGGTQRVPRSNGEEDAEKVKLERKIKEVEGGERRWISSSDQVGESLSGFRKRTCREQGMRAAGGGGLVLGSSELYRTGHVPSADADGRAADPHWAQERSTVLSSLLSFGRI